MDAFHTTTKPNTEAPASVRNRALPMPESGGAKWATLHIAGKVWSLRFGQRKKTVLDPNGDPMPSIPVVIVDVAKTKSKAYYADGFKPGENNPPDCASATATVPDIASPHRQHPVCATCPKNAVGSGKTAYGKACQDFRRVALVPFKSIDNRTLGGVPVMLRVPPDSLKNLEAFLNESAEIDAPFYTRVVKLKFDTTVHPKIIFEGIGYLDESQIPLVVEHRDNPLTEEMLTERLKVDGVEPEGEAESPASGVDATDKPTPVPVAPPPAPAPDPRAALSRKDQLAYDRQSQRLAEVRAEAAEAKAAEEKAAEAKVADPKVSEPAPAKPRTVKEAQAMAAAQAAAKAAESPAPEVSEPAAAEEDPFDALARAYAPAPESVVASSPSQVETPAAESPIPETPPTESSAEDTETASTGTDLDAMFDSLVTSYTGKKA